MKFKTFVLREEAPPDAPSTGLLGTAFKKAEEQRNPGTPPPGTPPEEFTPNPLWSHLEQAYQIQRPENLSPENEAQMIEQIYLERAQANIPKPELHPVVAGLNEQFQNPEFKYEEWLNAQVNKAQMMSKTGKDFYSEFLKMEYEGQVDDDTVNRIIDGMSDSELALKELEAKKQLRIREQEESAKKGSELQQQRARAYQEQTQKIEQEVQDLFARTKNVKEIYGVEVGEAEIDAFNKTFRELVLPDPETGEQAITQLLQSNDDLWKFAFMAIQGDTKLKEALSEAKEGTKNAVFSRLKRNPSTSGTRNYVPVSNKLDTDKWRKPSP